MLRRCLALVSFALVASPAWAQVRDGYVVFKDGFSVHGRVITPKKFEIDSVTGAGVTIAIPGATTYLDDDVRRVHFSPGQIQDVISVKPGELVREQMVLARNPIVPKKPLFIPAWTFEKVSEFDVHWERWSKVAHAKGKFDLHHRIVLLTPQKMYLQSRTHYWDVHFFTKEIEQEKLGKLLTDFYEDMPEAKKLAPYDKRFNIARFYLQAGRLEAAETELSSLYKLIPESKTRLDELGEAIAKAKAHVFAEELERLANAKQHAVVIKRLEIYDRDKLADRVSPKQQLMAQELKNRYEQDRKKLAAAQAALQYAMTQTPQPRGFWLTCVDAIGKELDLDTSGRLDTFVAFADQHQRDVKAGKTPTQKIEAVLSLAVTGWHLGNIAATPDEKAAQRLWKARSFLAEYLKADAAPVRKEMLTKWQAESGANVELVSRLLPNLPPLNPPKLSDEAFDVDIDLPDGPTGSYLVQLPPDYRPTRPHPVVMLLHGREAAEALVTRMRWLGAQYGAILVAPRWTKINREPVYQYGDREHKYFLGVLRDLRRRFNVDSDRVGLFGWDSGASVAWDLGMSHPDQFAGVVPMCGIPGPFCQKYVPNAQLLPFYIVDGDKSGNGPTLARELMKDWVRGNYPSYFLEYKGRANELYVAEFDQMMEWLSRKRRAFPLKGSTDEFRTHRPIDSHFYWLSTSEIDDNRTQELAAWVKFRQAATLSATLSVVNEADSKGNAKIVTHINAKTSGVKQLSFWLAPEMVDFANPIAVRINGRMAGIPRTYSPNLFTMLERFHETGDRQRLFVARIDLKVQ